MSAAPTLAQVVDLLDSRADPATAEDWDRVGLVTGDPGGRVARVVFTVDATPATIAAALDRGADLLVAHHPLLLRAVSSVAETDSRGRGLAALIRAGCALLTMHTNADRAEGGVNDALAAAIGLTGCEPLVPADAGGGLGRVGDLPPTSLRDLAGRVAAALPPTAAGVRVAGDPDRQVARVAVCGGAGDLLLGDVAAVAPDVYVTSDLRHHPALDFVSDHDIALIDIPHAAGEALWLHDWADWLATEAAVRGWELRSSVLPGCTDPWTFAVPGGLPAS